MNGKYCYSWDGERYYSKEETEAEALAEAWRDKPDAKSVYIGTCTEPELRWQSNEEAIIDSIADNLTDDVGEAAECFDVSDEDEKELANRIDIVVETWIKDRNIKASCYSVMDGHKVLRNQAGDTEAI